MTGKEWENKLSELRSKLNRARCENDYEAIWKYESEIAMLLDKVKTDLRDGKAGTTAQPNRRPDKEGLSARGSGGDKQDKKGGDNEGKDGEK